jgi:predicted DNA-binding mobile mystery protein A
MPRRPTQSKPSERLVLRQLDRRLSKVATISPELTPPKQGWLRTVREALGMSLRQVGERCGVRPQSVSAGEKAEAEGTASLANIKRLAEAMDAKLVYAIVPTSGSLEAALQARARLVAARILKTTAHTMALEDQRLSKGEIESQIEDLARDLLSFSRDLLWEDAQ